MGKWKRIYKIMILGMLVVMTAGIVVRASVSEVGSIRITLSDGEKGTEKAGVVFGYTKVACCVNGEYEAVKKYSGGIDFNKINTAKESEEAAEKMRRYVETPDGIIETDKDGDAEIQNLEMGLYLIYPLNTAKYDNILPFFASIPTWEEERSGMNFHVKIIPKHEAVFKKAPIAPQTNVDSEYQRKFVLSAGCILLAGLVFYANHRKKEER